MPSIGAPNMKDIFRITQPARIAVVALFALLFVIPTTTFAQAAAPAQAPAAVFAPVGVSNYGQVSAMLYRGAQPSSAGYEELKKFGITTVVNFRDEKDEIAKERSAVEALGMKYISIPWRGSDIPNNAQVNSFLQLMSSDPKQKIFVHCKEGRDRTGVMVAAYRMAFENWTVEKTVQEMYAYHYHHFTLPHLQQYVEGFPKVFAQDPTFSAVLTAIRALAPVSTVVAVAPQSQLN
jgi:tyrosine-protein phosphatase SIW14